jgi:hypothetical protein
MFGSDGVQPYIGELWIANKADAFLNQTEQQQTSLDDETTNTMQLQRAKRVRQLLESDDLVQRKRQVECAINIRRRVAPFTEEEKEEANFLALLQAEAADMYESSFGRVFCTTIGRTLEWDLPRTPGWGAGMPPPLYFPKHYNRFPTIGRSRRAGLSAVAVRQPKP